MVRLCRTGVVAKLLLTMSLVIATWGCSPPAETGGADDRNIPRITLNSADAENPAFEVVGLGAAQLAALEKFAGEHGAGVFEVFVAGAGPDVPPMLGAASVQDGRLRFVPRFPLAPGLRYRAVLRTARLSADGERPADVVAEFDIPPRPPRAATVVEHIYPSADRLPDNQLKFYLHFSAPMSRGEAYARIHLLDADGKSVEAAFLELGEELWDREMKRFTLLCDPGRIKRGLKPREEVGPVFQQGQRYTLVVDRDWRDGAGGALQEPARKSFLVLPADETPVDPAAWSIEPPVAETTGALTVRFPEPLDHSLLGRLIEVADPTGQKIDGKIEITDDETCWRFRPVEAWRAGAYQLVIDTALEDLAGNAVGRPFDVDVVEPIQNRITTKTVSIPFTIGG